MFRAGPVFHFTQESQDGEREIMEDINKFFTDKRTEERA